MGMKIVSIGDSQGFRTIKLKGLCGRFFIMDSTSADSSLMYRYCRITQKDPAIYVNVQPLPECTRCMCLIAEAAKKAQTDKSDLVVIS